MALLIYFKDKKWLFVINFMQDVNDFGVSYLDIWMKIGRILYDFVAKYGLFDHFRAPNQLILTLKL